MPCRLIPRGIHKPDPFYKKVFKKIEDRSFQAVLRSQGKGILAGIPFAEAAVDALGLKAVWRKKSGESVRIGEEIARFKGTPEQIIKGENFVIGLISKPSGIATAARKAKKAGKGRLRLVSGGWKKHPFLVKEMIREAIIAGGLFTHMVDPPFLYLDKNYVRIFGGIGRTLRSISASPEAKIVQVRGEFRPIGEEAREAIANGAKVVMVDTGSWADLDEVLRVVRTRKAFSGVKTAFAGGVQIKDIPVLGKKGVDILDIGAAVLDAPWLELSYDVVGER